MSLETPSQTPSESEEKKGWLVDYENFIATASPEEIQEQVDFIARNRAEATRLLDSGDVTSAQVQLKALEEKEATLRRLGKIS